MILIKLNKNQGPKCQNYMFMTNFWICKDSQTNHWLEKPCYIYYIYFLDKPGFSTHLALFHQLSLGLVDTWSTCFFSNNTQRSEILDCCIKGQNASRKVRLLKVLRHFWHLLTNLTHNKGLKWHLQDCGFGPFNFDTLAIASLGTQSTKTIGYRT